MDQRDGGDPDTEMTPLGHLYGLVALAVFVVLDGPLVLVRALVESYAVLPPDWGGNIVWTEAMAEHTFGRVAGALTLALTAAAPAALSVTAAGIALGLLGRLAPSLPLLVLALPVRFLAALVLVMLSLATLSATLATAWGHWPGGL